MLFQYVFNTIFHMSRLTRSVNYQLHPSRDHPNQQVFLKRKLCHFNHDTVMVRSKFETIEKVTISNFCFKILKDLISGMKDCRTCSSPITLHKDKQQFAPPAVLTNRFHFTIVWYTQILMKPQSFACSSKFGFGLVMGPGQFFVARVGSAIYGLGLNLENFP